MWQTPSRSHLSRRRRRCLIVACLTVAALTCLGLSQWRSGTPVIVYNASRSVPKGFYRVSAATSLRRGDLVLMTTPDSVRGLADARRYLPATVPLIKTVAALPGDQICAFGTRIFINGRLVATRLSHDSEGRPLPSWQGCRTLAKGEFLPLVPDSPRSFDGRYFAAVPVTRVRGRLEPL